MSLNACARNSFPRKVLHSFVHRALSYARQIALKKIFVNERSSEVQMLSQVCSYVSPLKPPVPRLIFVNYEILENCVEMMNYV